MGWERVVCPPGPEGPLDSCGPSAVCGRRAAVSGGAGRGGSCSVSPGSGQLAAPSPAVRPAPGREARSPGAPGPHGLCAEPGGAGGVVKPPLRPTATRGQWQVQPPPSPGPGAAGAGRLAPAGRSTARCPVPVGRGADPRPHAPSSRRPRGAGRRFLPKREPLRALWAAETPLSSKVTQSRSLENIAALTWEPGARMAAGRDHDVHAALSRPPPGLLPGSASDQRPPHPAVRRQGYVGDPAVPVSGPPRAGQAPEGSVCSSDLHGDCAARSPRSTTRWR